jgi:RNA methyltransferase, TrmH family
MTRRLLVTSSRNDRVKAVRRLRRRCSGDLFLAEGRRQLEAALDAGADVREVLAAPDLFLHPGDTGLVAAAERRGAEVLEIGAAAFRSVSNRVRPDGLISVVQRPQTPLSGLRRRSFLVVAESIERPGNLGAIVRTACAAGADGLVACDARAGLFHADTVRAAVGALFRLPLAETSTERACARVREWGVRVVVATPDGTLAHDAVEYGSPVAIVVGNERHGVSDAWRRAADETVFVPMPGPADSLNVAVAAGIVLFEVAARSRAGGLSRPAP